MFYQMSELILHSEEQTHAQELFFDMNSDFRWIEMKSHLFVKD